MPAYEHDIIPLSTPTTEFFQTIQRVNILRKYTCQADLGVEACDREPEPWHIIIEWSVKHELAYPKQAQRPIIVAPGMSLGAAQRPGRIYSEDHFSRDEVVLASLGILTVGAGMVAFLVGTTVDMHKLIAMYTQPRARRNIKGPLVDGEIYTVYFSGDIAQITHRTDLRRVFVIVVYGEPVTKFASEYEKILGQGILPGFGDEFVVTTTGYLTYPAILGGHFC